MALDTQENFKQDVLSKLQEVDNLIESFETHNKSYDGKPSKDTIEDLNILKLNKYKLKEMYEWLEVNPEEKWLEKQAYFQKKYESILDKIKLRKQA